MVADAGITVYSWIPCAPLVARSTLQTFPCITTSQPRVMSVTMVIVTKGVQPPKMLYETHATSDKYVATTTRWSK